MANCRADRVRILPQAGVFQRGRGTPENLLWLPDSLSPSGKGASPSAFLQARTVSSSPISTRRSRPWRRSPAPSLMRTVGKAASLRAKRPELEAQGENDRQGTGGAGAGSHLRWARSWAAGLLPGRAERRSSPAGAARTLGEMGAFYVLQAEVPGGLFPRPEIPDAPGKREPGCCRAALTTQLVQGAPPPPPALRGQQDPLRILPPSWCLLPQHLGKCP